MKKTTYQKRAEIIYQIIKLETFDKKVLSRITGHTIGKVNLAIDFYKKNNYSIYLSLSVSNLFYIYDKRNDSEVMIWIYDHNINSLSQELQKELILTIKSFGIIK